MSDTELIKNAKRGDLQSFSSLIRSYQGKVFAYLAVRLANRHEAEDMTQEVFLTAFKKIKSFDENMPIAPWLRGIAANRLRNHWRKKKTVNAGSSTELEALINEKIEIPA
jgi:RNA polymerase sigma-70 factor (ECF subfamily)